MEIVSLATGEVITEADVDASMGRVIQHAESIWDEWAWQVENETWTLKGYSSWDEMRLAVYGGSAAITAPRQDRPELVARFRRAGLTQHQTAATLGISRPTVARYDEPTYEPRRANVSNETFAADGVIDAEIVDDDPTSPEPERPARADTDGAELAFINDLRGPWARGITVTARRANPRVRALIIEALEGVLKKIKEIHNAGTEV